MNTIIILTGILSCILLMLSVTHAYTSTGKENDDDHQMLLDRQLAYARNKFFSTFQDDDSMNNSEEDDGHEMEKRRFNAWAGKRSLVGKRRFNAWAGRR